MPSSPRSQNDHPALRRLRRVVLRVDPSAMLARDGCMRRGWRAHGRASMPRLPLSRMASARRHLPHGLGAHMSEMIQRVAEKICDDLSCDATCEARPGLCERIARAAIAATREPDEAVIHSGYQNEFRSPVPDDLIEIEG